jgi:RNA polymerase sigma-70 factor, ECF subfamily
LHTLQVTLQATCSREYQLVRLAQRGDEAAFEQIYRSHCKRVYAVCLHMVRNEAEAEDLTQEAFLQAFRKIHTFRWESRFSTWMYRLAVNTALMRLRKRRQGKTSLQDFADSDEQKIGNRSGELRAYDRRLGSAIDRVTLVRAIAQLPDGLPNDVCPA